MNTFRVTNNLDPDQDRHSVGPDLGPNCLQRFSTDHPGDKNILILHLFCRTIDFEFYFTLQTHALVL